VVTEAGGALAHLSQIAMERGINLVRLADARTRIPAGTRVWWSIADGECSIHVTDPHPDTMTDSPTTRQED
jgi:hypothetical protein